MLNKFNQWVKRLVSLLDSRKKKSKPLSPEKIEPKETVEKQIQSVPLPKNPPSEETNQFSILIEELKKKFANETILYFE